MAFQALRQGSTRRDKHVQIKRNNGRDLNVDRQDASPSNCPVSRRGHLHRDRSYIDSRDGAGAQEQYFGIPSSRVGPYSAMGTGYYGGIIDYLNYVNMKQAASMA